MKNKIVCWLFCAGILFSVSVNKTFCEEQHENNLRWLMKEYEKAALAYQKEAQSDVKKKKPRTRSRKRSRKKGDAFLAFASSEVLKKDDTTGQKNWLVSSKRLASNRKKTKKKVSTKKRVVAKKSSVTANKESIFSPKVELKTAIMIAAKIKEHKAAQERKVLRAKLDNVVEKKMDSVSIDEVIGLLDLEIKLVKGLLLEKRGQDVTDLLSEKKQSLGTAGASSALAYETIMKFATSTEDKGRQIRKNYLKNVSDILERYRMEFGYKQYHVRNGSALPEQRYQRYLTSPQKIGEVKTSVNAFAVVTDGWLESFPYFCSLSKKIGAKKELGDDIGVFRANFAALWANITDQMNKDQIVSLFDDLIYLVKHEEKNHVDSFANRAKMFSGKEEKIDVKTNLDISGTVTSKRAQVLFGTLRDAAAMNTMNAGGWNPDLYEKNLNSYAKRLARFRGKCERLLGDLGTKCDSCCQLQDCLDLLMSSIVYSSFAS